VGEVELAVATAHRRAAEVYESWLQQGLSVFSRQELARRAQLHRDELVESRRVERLVERTLRMFEGRVVAAGPERGKVPGLLVLGALARLKTALGNRIDAQVGVCRDTGATWADIAAALGVTRQTAHERYRQHDEGAGSP
jgi:hypothetical protein